MDRLHDLKNGGFLAHRSRMEKEDETEIRNTSDVVRTGDLEQNIADFVSHYNHLRYHESITNLTPADVYFGRGQTILLEREWIKHQTFKIRRLLHRKQAA
ncbi:MAG: integrase core domain-containing protein [Aestuariivirga sp.]